MASASSFISASAHVDASIVLSQPPLPADSFCEQLEVEFPSVSDRSFTFSGHGAPVVDLAGQRQDVVSSGPEFFGIFSSLTVSETSFSLFMIQHNTLV